MQHSSALSPAIAGTVNLQDILIRNLATATFKVRNASTNHEFGPWEVRVGLAGEFIFPAPPPGTYHVTAWGKTFLSDTVGPVDLTNGHTGLAFDLVNGDANGDNRIDIADFVELRRRMAGSDSGSADFNRDGSVNVADFLILRKNFGRSGT